MLSSLAEGSNLPLPTADKAGQSRDCKGAAHWTSAGAICHSRAIGNPAGLSPGGRGRPGRRQCRRPGRVRGPLCHSCTSRNPGFFGCAPWCHPCESRDPGFFAPPPVSFLRKQEPTQCPSCASSSPARLSPPRERPACFADRLRGRCVLPAQAEIQEENLDSHFRGSAAEVAAARGKGLLAGEWLALFATHPP